MSEEIVAKFEFEIPNIVNYYYKCEITKDYKFRPSIVTISLYECSKLSIECKYIKISSLLYKKDALPIFFNNIPKKYRKEIINKLGEEINRDISSAISNMVNILEYHLIKVLESVQMDFTKWYKQATNDEPPTKKVTINGEEKIIIDFDSILDHEEKTIEEMLTEKRFPESIRDIFYKYFAYKQLDKELDNAKYESEGLVSRYFGWKE